MAMIIIGSLLEVFGWAAIILGIRANHNAWAQLAAIIRTGSDDPGNVLIVIGAIMAIGGFFLSCAGYKQRREQKDRETMMYMQMLQQQGRAADQAAARAAAPAQAGGPPPLAGYPAPPPAADFRLQGVTGTFAGKRFSMEKTVRVGRDPGRNDLVFPAGTQGVSSVHCVLTVDGSTVWLKDLGSTHGTFLANGTKLQPNVPVRLKVGDRFWLGSRDQTFAIAPKGGLRN